MTAKRTDRPTSPARVTANRANALRSTGPRTTEGKRRSAANAVKHGVLTHPFTLWRDEAGLSAFQKLYAALLDELEPVGVMEGLAVERIALAYWRLRRLARAESMALAGLHGRHGRPADVAHALPRGDDLDRFARYHVTLERQLERATRELDRLQDRRRAEEADGARPRRAATLSLTARDGETLEHLDYLAHETEDGGLDPWVEVAYRLVEEEDRRLEEEANARAAEQYRLASADRKLRNEPNDGAALPAPPTPWGSS